MLLFKIFQLTIFASDEVIGWCLLVHEWYHEATLCDYELIEVQISTALLNNETWQGIRDKVSSYWHKAHCALGDLDAIFKKQYFYLDECHRILLLISQHWFRYWLMLTQFIDAYMRHWGVLGEFMFLPYWLNVLHNYIGQNVLLAWQPSVTVFICRTVSINSPIPIETVTIYMKSHKQKENNFHSKCYISQYKQLRKNLHITNEKTTHGRKEQRSQLRGCHICHFPISGGAWGENTNLSIDELSTRLRNINIYVSIAFALINIGSVTNTGIDHSQRAILSRTAPRLVLVVFHTI